MASSAKKKEASNNAGWDGDSQGFCSFYRKLESSTLEGQNGDDSIVRLFERDGGAVYSVYGKNALFVAETVYQTTTIIKYLGEGKLRDPLPSCTLLQPNAMAFLRRLLLADNMRIEIWTSNGGRGSSSPSNWSISKRASPGNLQQVEGLLFANTDIAQSPIVVVLKISSSGDKKTVGAAFTDALTMEKIYVCEFVDSDTFSSLESFLVQLGAKEVLVSDGNTEPYDFKQIQAVLSRVGATFSNCKSSEFDTRNLEHDADLLLGVGLEKSSSTSIVATELWELKFAMSCLASLIRFLDLLSDASNIGHYSIETFDLSNFMRLDASAVKALNIFPGKGNSNGTMSLFGLFNSACQTSQGSRLLSQWLQQPLVDLPSIETRQELVSLLCANTEIRKLLHEEHLRRFPDLHRLSKKFQRKSGASLEDVVRIYQCVIRLPLLVECLESLDQNNDDSDSVKSLELLRSNITSELQRHAEALDTFAQLVETTIDLEAINHHEYIIKPDFHEELLEARKKMKKVHASMEPEARRVADDLDLEYEKKLKFEHNSQYGYHLRLSRMEAHKMRGNRDLIELSTQKTGVIFTTIRLKRASEEYEEWGNIYSKLQSNLAKEVIDVTGSYYPVLEELNQAIARLDVWQAFAHVSMHAPVPFVRPTLSPLGSGDVLHLERSRHPCLEVQDDVSFIENDVLMERGKSSFQIITGPNMGGKSTYIRQIGVIALLAQVGSFVPCQSASLPIFDSILARVGAGDAQIKGISTFMAEMLETSAILRKATSNSLVIIDELGRGTSTSDGFGLAWAISEHIASKINCFSLFATHFHELTALSERYAQVENCHVEAVAQAGSITLLYKVRPGVCDQSFGIHVAELADFPSQVIKLSKRKADELENFGGDGDRKLWKSSPEDIKTGMMMIKAYLQDFASRDEGDAVSGASHLQARLSEIKDLPFVQEVLTSLSSSKSPATR